MKPTCIAIITDFGLHDPYVSIMKGVITSIAPEIPLIDITHQVPPGDIQRGAFILWQASRDLPKGTIFLGVVDPGVGTERRALFLETRDQIFIGPDNGLFSYLLYNMEFSCWELSNPDYQRSNTSATFHGRDIFAPAAAHAARSVSGDQFGDQLELMNTLSQPTLTNNKSSIAGEILSADHFGNLFTSLGLFKYQNDSLVYQSWIDGAVLKINRTTRIRIQINEHQLSFVNTFASIDPGSCAGLVGSTGLLEIAANQSSAKALLGLEVGDSVILSWD